MKIFLGTADAAKCAKISPRQFRRKLSSGELTPDAMLQAGNQQIALWEPERLKRLKLLMTEPEQTL